MNALLVSHPCETLGVQLRASMPLYERSVGFASLQSFWAFNFGHPCPSLVKGEVLSPEKIRATTGGIASRCTEPLYPHDHCKRTITPRSHQPSSKPHYPSKSTTPLASPRKRGGGTADIIFGLAVQYSDSPAFTILKLFRAVTVGIAPHPHHH